LWWHPFALRRGFGFAFICDPHPPPRSATPPFPRYQNCHMGLPFFSTSFAWMLCFLVGLVRFPPPPASAPFLEISNVVLPLSRTPRDGVSVLPFFFRFPITRDWLRSDCGPPFSLVRCPPTCVRFFPFPPLAHLGPWRPRTDDLNSPFPFRPVPPFTRPPVGELRGD